MPDTPTAEPVERQPIFNMPPVVVVLVVAMLAIHAGFQLLPDSVYPELLYSLAFVSGRFGPSGDIVPGGEGARLWSWITYAFLHADWVHVAFNLPMLAALGSLFVRRAGAARFLVFFVLTAAAAAGTHLLTHPGDYTPVIGASGAVSGLLGAWLRFAYAPGGPMAPVWIRTSEGPMRVASPRVPALGILEALGEKRVLAFLVVFFILNMLFAFGGGAIVGEQSSVAWEAHLGGLAAGFLAFGWVDPVPRLRPEGRA